MKPDLPVGSICILEYMNRRYMHRSDMQGVTAEVSELNINAHAVVSAAK